ncbi:MAG: FMN-binding protein, partial [Actinomycetes bacterium]
GNSGSNNSNSNNSGSGNSAVSKKVTGASIDVGYGLVQVQAVVKGGKLVDVTAVALPNNDNHSARISEQAFPMLVQQALQAQSSNISGISGASYTSYGFVKSLESALSQAGLKG